MDISKCFDIAAQKMAQAGHSVDKKAISIKFFPGRKGVASVEVIGQDSYQLNINDQFQTAIGDPELQAIFISILCHEFCHYLLMDYGFRNYYRFNDTLGTLACEDANCYELARIKIFDNKGHTATWERLVEDVNQKVNLKYPIVTSLDDEVKNLFHRNNIEIEEKNKEQPYLIPITPMVDELPDGITIEDFIANPSIIYSEKYRKISMEEALKILEELDNE